MKTSFILYADAYDNIKTLDDAQLGRLLRAIYIYHRGEDLPEMDPAVGMAFSFLRQAFDRDAAKYQEKCEKAKESIRKRWNTDVYERKNIDTNHTDTVSVLDTVPETDIKKKPCVVPSPDFEKFWALYPRHTAKANALKAWQKLDREKALPSLDVLAEAIDAQSGANKWERDNFKYCPHPATWLNARRWEDEDAAGGYDWRGVL